MCVFIKKVCIDWEHFSEESYLHHIPALTGMKELSFSGPVTYFAGENGTGKSTLLEAIAIAWGFNPEGGSIHYSFSIHDSHSGLWEAVTIVRGARTPKWGYFLRAESFYNVATKEAEYADGNHPSMGLHEQSHGESFLAVMRGKLSVQGLYILDEPEAALSPQSQLAFLVTMKQAVEKGAQFIIASHSPILLGYPDADIWSFDKSEPRLIAYEDTESYQVTEMFLHNRESLLTKLLGR